MRRGAFSEPGVSLHASPGPAPTLGAGGEEKKEMMRGPVPTFSSENGVRGPLGGLRKAPTPCSASHCLGLLHPLIHELVQQHSWSTSILPRAGDIPRLKSETGCLVFWERARQASQPRGSLQQTWKRGSLEKWPV